MYLSITNKDLFNAAIKLDKKHETITQDRDQSVVKAQTDASIAALIKQERGKDTLHKLKMRKLAKTLAERINLPSLWDKDLLKDLPVDFQPGKYYLPIGEVEIDKDKHINVNYYDVCSGIAEPHLVRGLYSHLSTSGLSKFSELVGDKGQLQQLLSAIGKYSNSLMTFLKIITNEAEGYRAKVFFHDEAMSGLTRSFIVTIWKDAIEEAGGHSWIDNSWYKPQESIPDTNLWQLKCGGYIIGIAKSNKTLKTYENWHKNLRGKYAEDPLARRISATQQELNNIAQTISQRLQEFSDIEHLPGHCELC
jgi:hypothetical protein